MIAYHDGSLFKEITKALKSSEEIFTIMKSELGLDHFPEKQIKSLLDAILKRFHNIRGRWFVNNVRGQKQHKSSWSTRETVSKTTEVARAKIEAII